MSETELDCPVDGCDYSGTQEQLKGHSNASRDHPNWAEIKDQVGETTTESGDSEDSEGGEATPEKTPKQGSEGAPSEPPGEETSKPTDSETSKGGEKAPEGAGTEDEDSDTDMNEEQEQWSKVDGKSGDGSTERGVDEAGDEETTQDGGLGIPIPVSTTTLFLVVGLLAMGILLYQYATLGDSTDETGETDVQQPDPDDEQASSEGGLIAE